MKLLNCLKYSISGDYSANIWFLPHEAEELALSLRMWMTTVYQHPEVVVAWF